MIHFANALRGETTPAVFRRGTIIALISFLTLIDLFGSQALLPMLVEAYGVDAGTMGFAVNASTFGMAIAGLFVAWFADRIDRRRGIWVSLALLSIPTFLLGITQDVTMFGILRVLQGMCMATAFTLTLTYLSEQCDITAASMAMAAYITGNVGSNLFGRLMAVSFADGFGIAGSFFAFAALNLLGAIIALLVIGVKSKEPPARGGSPLDAWKGHMAVPSLRASFGLGFIILFAFVGVFTYVNFELVGPVLDLHPDYLGVVYFVFLPALFTTPLASPIAKAFGPRKVFWLSCLISIIGLALTLVPNLAAVLAGLALIGMGLFFAQAAATAFVGRAATSNHAAANGLYLTSYYVGGLVGAFALGQIYDGLAWEGVVAVILASLVVAMLLAVKMKQAEDEVPA